MIRREGYLEKLIARIDDSRVKVVTGLRRCGKSYLLFDIFRPWLRRHGYDAAHVVAIQLDDDDAVEQRTPRALSVWIKARLPKDGGKCIVMIDEIQMCKPPEDAPENGVTFYDVLNSLRKKKGVSVYVTGSNSEMLSKDVSTTFRDRGIEIRVWPLSFAELLRHRKGVESAVVWEEYLRSGGMPGAVLEKDREERERYLKGLFSTVYNRDLVERYDLKDDYVLDSVVAVLSSSVGSLTNPTKLANSMKTVCKVAASAPTSMSGLWRSLSGTTPADRSVGSMRLILSSTRSRGRPTSRAPMLSKGKARRRRRSTACDMAVISSPE